MTASPTAADARAALARLNGFAPDDTATVAAYLDRQQRLAARLISQQAGVEERVRDLARQIVTGDGSDTTFVTVAEDGAPVDISNSSGYAEDALELLRQLRAVRRSPDEIGIILQTLATSRGRDSLPLFASTLTMSVVGVETDEEQPTMPTPENTEAAAVTLLVALIRAEFDVEQIRTVILNTIASDDLAGAFVSSRALEIVFDELLAPIYNVSPAGQSLLLAAAEEMSRRRG